MGSISQPERATQERVITLFRDELHYRYLGDWSERAANSNIDEPLLTAYLGGAGYVPAQINRALARGQRNACGRARPEVRSARPRGTRPTCPDGKRKPGRCDGMTHTP